MSFFVKNEFGRGYDSSSDDSDASDSVDSGDSSSGATTFWVKDYKRLDALLTQYSQSKQKLITSHSIKPYVQSLRKALGDARVSMRDKTRIRVLLKQIPDVAILRAAPSRQEAYVEDGLGNRRLSNAKILAGFPNANWQSMKPQLFSSNRQITSNDLFKALYGSILDDMKQQQNWAVQRYREGAEGPLQPGDSYYARVYANNTGLTEKFEELRRLVARLQQRSRKPRRRVFGDGLDPEA